MGRETQREQLESTVYVLRRTQLKKIFLQESLCSQMLICVILSDTLRNFFGYSAASSSDSSIFIYFVLNIDPLQSRERS